MSSCRVVLSSLPFPHLSTWVRRRPLFMISILGTWTTWCYITRRWSLICGGALIDIARGQRREATRFWTWSVPLLSVPLVRPYLLHRLVMMELLRRVIVLRLIALGSILCVSLFCIVSICACHVFMLFHPIFGSWWELICIWFDVYVVHMCIMYV